MQAGKRNTRAQNFLRAGEYVPYQLVPYITFMEGAMNRVVIVP